MNASRALLAARLVFAGLLAAILWLALTPQPPDPIDTGWDKLNHVLAFGALAATGWFGFVEPGVRAPRVAGLVVALLVVGIGIEALQSLLPPRVAEALDVVADSVGIGAGLALAAAVAALRRRWNPPASRAPRAPHGTAPRRLPE